MSIACLVSDDTDTQDALPYTVTTGLLLTTFLPGALQLSRSALRRWKNPHTE